MRGRRADARGVLGSPRPVCRPIPPQPTNGRMATCWQTECPSRGCPCSWDQGPVSRDAWGDGRAGDSPLQPHIWPVPPVPLPGDGVAFTQLPASLPASVPAAQQLPGVLDFLVRLRPRSAGWAWPRWAREGGRAPPLWSLWEPGLDTDGGTGGKLSECSRASPLAQMDLVPRDGCVSFRGNLSSPEGASPLLGGCWAQPPDPVAGCQAPLEKNARPRAQCGLY